MINLDIFLNNMDKNPIKQIWFRNSVPKMAKMKLWSEVLIPIQGPNPEPNADPDLDAYMRSKSRS